MIKGIGMPAVKNEKTREMQIDELIHMMEIHERINRDGILFRIKRTLHFPGTRIEQIMPDRKKQEIKKLAERKSYEELDAEVAKQKKKLEEIASRMERRHRKSAEFEKKIKEIQQLIGKMEEKEKPSMVPPKVEEKERPKEMPVGAAVERKPEKVEVIHVHITSMPRKKKKPEKVKKKRAFEGIIRKIGKLRIRKKKPAGKPFLPKVPPREVKEALEESQREKSKIEMMIKDKGKGWYGERLRHQRVALKAWETTRRKELAQLEKMEKRGKLSKEEIGGREGAREEMKKIRRVIGEVDKHLREIEKHRGKVKAAAVSMAVMKEARKAAEKAAEAAKAMPKYAAPQPRPVQIVVGKIEGREELADIGEEITRYRNLMKRLEVDYLKRRISEDDYRRKLSEYQHGLNELEEKKRAKEAKKPGIEKEIPVKVTEAKPIEVAMPAAVPEQAIEQPAAPLTQKAIKTLQKGPPTEITHEKVTEIEKHIEDLLKKYSISKDEMEKEGKLDTNRIFQDFDKLINLVELEREAIKLKGEEAAPAIDILSAIIPKQREKIKAMAKEIKKYRIVTDFDRVLSYVREKGKVNADKVRKELNIDKRRFKECYAVLEKSGLIRIEYPAIGSTKLVDVNYKELKKRK